MPTMQEALERVWSDEALKNRLISDPKPVLSEFGLEIPDTISVQIHENSATVMNFVLPAQAALEGIDPEAADPIIGKVIKRAWADSGFKAKLIAEPKAAIQEATGVALPDTLQVNVYENTATLEHLVLPINPNDSELSDADLEGVAGGLSKGAQWGVGCGSAGAVTGIAGGALAFTVVGGIVTGVSAGVASGISTAGGTVASSKGKC
jgi:Nitrile hydratase, alpha chain